MSELAHERHDKRSLLRNLLRVVLFLYFVAVTCPIQFFYFEDYLDLSWVLAINVAAEQSVRYGQDFFWTYGPFAYLGSPLPVGDNLRDALAMQSALWAAAAAVGFDLFFIQVLPLGGLLALSLAAAMAWPLFHFNYGGAENLIGFLAYLLLASALRRRNWAPSFALAAFLCGLAAMFKLSAAAAIAGALLGAAAVMTYRSRELGFRAAAVGGVIVPLSFGGLYWLHNPSWTGLLGYLWGLGEFSGGYSTAMSRTDIPLLLIAAGALELGVCLALLLHERRNAKDNSLALVAVFLLPVAMSWKHMIVRLDVLHLPAFFSFAALVMGTLIAFRERPSRKPAVDWLAFLFAAAVIIFLTQPVMAFGSSLGDDFSKARRRVLSGAAALQHVHLALDIEQTRRDLLRISAAKLEHKLLPAAIRERIGAQSVGFFGSNFPFAVLDDLDIRLTPTVQLYAAFTPDLDQVCADWYREEAPELLLMDWSAIDGRHPLTQAPRSWMEVWRWYDAELLDGEWLLLRRRAAARFGEPIRLEAKTVHGAEPIEVPDSTGPLLVATRRALNIKGRLAKTFHHVPPILQQYDRGEQAVAYRAILDVMDYATLLTPLPMSLGEAALLLAPGESVQPVGVSTFRFVGAEEHYVGEYEVEFFELHPKLSGQTAPAANH